MPSRRAVLAAPLVAALAPVAAGAAAAVAPQAGEWLTAAGGLTAWRHSPRPLGGERERWRVHLAGGVPGAPAISRGTVVAASYGGDVVAVDLRTGVERWRRTLPAAVYGDSITVVGARELGSYAGPAISGDRVLVATDRMYCLDVRTGRSLWVARPLGTADSDDYFWGAPVVVGSLVLAGSGSGSELARARGHVSAYDLRTGRLAWSTPMVPVGGNGGGVLAPVTVDARRGSVYAATGSPYSTVDGPNPGTCALVELELRTGAVRWVDQLHAHDTQGLDLNSAPVLVGDVVAVTGKDGVHAWDRVRRRRLWARALAPAEIAPGAGANPASGSEGGPLACDGRSLYTLANSGPAAVAAALDPRTGAVRWTARLPGITTAAPVVAGDVLWAATVSSLLVGLRTADGSVAAAIPLREPSSGAPALGGGCLVVGTGAAPYFPGESVVCIG